MGTSSLGGIGTTRDIHGKLHPKGRPKQAATNSVDRYQDDRQPTLEFASTAAEKHLKQHFDDINKLFRCDLNGIRIVYATGRQATAGHFKPESRGARPKRPARKLIRTKGAAAYSTAIDAYRQRVKAYNNRTPAPEIRIVNRRDGVEGEVRASVFHEWAHAADYQIIGEHPDGGELGTRLEAWEATKRQFATDRSNGIISRSPRYLWKEAPTDTGEPMHDFLALASRANSIDAWTESTPLGRRPEFELCQYMRSPEELWARAVSQWSSRQLDGDVKSGTSIFAHAFSAAEISRLSPKIEAVLEERKLLR